MTSTAPSVIRRGGTRPHCVSFMYHPGMSGPLTDMEEQVLHSKSLVTRVVYPTSVQDLVREVKYCDGTKRPYAVTVSSIHAGIKTSTDAQGLTTCFPAYCGSTLIRCCGCMFHVSDQVGFVFSKAAPGKPAVAMTDEDLVECFRGVGALHCGFDTGVEFLFLNACGTAALAKRLHVECGIPVVIGWRSPATPANQCLALVRTHHKSAP